MIRYEIKGPASQELTRSRIRFALSEGRFPQAILIDGPEGIGKKKLALELLQALQCTDKIQRPCQKCFACKMAKNSEVVSNWLVPLSAEEASAKSDSEVKAGSSAKTIEDHTQGYVQKIMENPYAINYLAPGAFISVDLIRALSRRFSFTESGVRCVVIPEAERMNTSAANAFLKTLEEVPQNTYFILTSPSRDLLLETIRSRCLSIHLPACTDDEVREIIQKETGKEASKNTLGLSFGSPGRALFFEEHTEELCEFASLFISKSLSGDYSEILWKIQSEISGGILNDVSSTLLFLDVLASLLADCARMFAECSPRLETTRFLFEKISSTLSPGDIHLALRYVQETSRLVSGRSVSVRVSLSSLSLKMFAGYR